MKGTGDLGRRCCTTLRSLKCLNWQSPVGSPPPLVPDSLRHEVLAAAPAGLFGQQQDAGLGPHSHHPVLAIEVLGTLGRQSTGTVPTSLRSVISFCTSLLGAVWTFTLASRAVSSFLRLSTFLRA